jgi:pyruvate,water dikinase
VTTGYADKAEYFVATLARGIGTIAAAFHPRPIILRMSDFKTNEYASLIGGAAFEPAEDNPMIGWRGACRYYHPDYREGFELELRAVERVRNTFGLRNVKLMIPFCRTPAEGREVLEVMRQNGLERGKDDLEVYVMAELPSNIFEADEFAAIFDGFSIGSNDLTQLVLGVDRDSEKVAPLFDERSDSVRRAIVMLLTAARRNGKPVGICGQAPSDYPEFAAFLVEHGIDSISLSSDALVETLHKIVEIEQTKSAAFA